LLVLSSQGGHHAWHRRQARRDGIRRVITDEAWAQLKPILAQVLSRTGAPPKLAVRAFLEAVLYLARTGSPWRDLPRCFGTWDAVYQRFRRWQKRGRWAALWRVLQAPAAAQAKSLFVDSTVVRAHQHAAGGPGTAEDRAVGRSRGGFGTKIHLAAADARTALAVALTAGQAGDAPTFEGVMCDLPDETAEAVVADRSYDRTRSGRTWRRVASKLSFRPGATARSRSRTTSRSTRSGSGWSGW
jgi:transposase